VSWDSVGTWTGVVVSVVGFVLALKQIRKTQGAVESAAKAIETTEARLARDRLLLLVSDLRQHEEALATALGDDSVANSLLALTRWRHVASQVSRLVSHGYQDESALLQVLEEALVLAEPALQSLAGGTGPAANRIPTAWTVLAQATTLASGFAEELTMYTSRDD
jgi:hypothetical protein